MVMMSNIKRKEMGKTMPMQPGNKPDKSKWLDIAVGVMGVMAAITVAAALGAWMWS